MDLRRRRAPPHKHVFVITSLAPPGVVIQLDGHGAKRLAMTFSGFIAAVTQTAGLAAGSPNDDKKQCEPGGLRLANAGFSFQSKVFTRSCRNLIVFPTCGDQREFSGACGICSPMTPRANDPS